MSLTKSNYSCSNFLLYIQSQLGLDFGFDMVVRQWISEIFEG